MAFSKQDILDALPHREPFLFVEEILEVGEKYIKTAKNISPDEDYLRGHFPGFPVVPGVIVCETIFQTGAILLARLGPAQAAKKLPVISRVGHVKLKQLVRPGDRLICHVDITETIGEVFYLKGSASVSGKVVVTLDFACNLIDKR